MPRVEGGHQRRWQVRTVDGDRGASAGVNDRGCLDGDAGGCRGPEPLDAGTDCDLPESLRESSQLARDSLPTVER
jgi:hypothetical protein